MTSPPRATTETPYGVEREFGFEPRFVFRGATIGAGQLIDAVARQPDVSLDFDALNVFLRTDMFLDGGTPFREVRRFSPPPTIVAPVDMTRTQAIEGYIDLFRQAIARRATPESVLPLSGGQDSRHILLELNAQGCLPGKAFTVAVRTSTDADVAREIARAVGVPHHVERPNRSLEGVRYTLRATDLMSQQHAWFADATRSRDARPWWDGIAGDVLSAGTFLEDWNVQLFQTGRLDELAERLVRRGRVPYFRNQGSFPRERALDRVRNELVRHVNAANPVGSYYFWNRTRVNIAASAFGLLRPAGEPTLAPFLDRDVWRFLSSIPLRHVIDQQLHIDVIRRAYPEFAHIGHSHKKSPGVGFFMRHCLRLLAHLATQRPSLRNLGYAGRAIRSMLIPSRAHDIEWIVTSWFFGDAVERTLRGVHA